MGEPRLPLRIGGVVRCCILTLESIGPSASMTKEGDTLSCSYCSSGLIVRDGAWEWWRDKPKDDEPGGRLTLHRIPLGGAVDVTDQGAEARKGGGL